MKFQKFLRNFIFLNYLYKNEKFRFFIFGFFNFAITNAVLQILLFITKIPIAALIAQITNLTLGYYFSSKKIFISKNSTKVMLVNYIFLGFFSWNFNVLSIKYISEIFEISSNLSAIFIIPFLTLWSYFVQKLFIFRS